MIKPKTQKGSKESKSTGRRYLVTGGAGFIGSWLAERLLADGHDVVVMDDLSTGRLDNISPLEDNPRFEWVNDSVANEPLLQNIMDDVHAVYHLASGVGVLSVLQSPVHTIEATLYGTEVVLNCAAAAGNKKVLITSSSEVYGKSAKVPFQEDDDIAFGPTTMTRWSYGCSKAVDEFLALAYHQEMKLPVVLTRLFNTVGPRQRGDFGMVLPRFVSAAVKGAPIQVYGDGLQSRCFCHVHDTVEALIKLMDCPDAEGRVINVGSDAEVSMNALAERVRARVNPKAAVEHVPYEKAYVSGFEDLRRRVPDLTRVRGLINFKAARTLDDIIDDVAAEMRAKQERIDKL